MDSHASSRAGSLARSAQPWAFLLHDLQQPLQAARLFADLLAGAPDPDRQRIAMALQGALAIMDAMVGGAAEAAAGDAIPLAPTPLGPVLDRLREQCAPVAEAHGVALRTVPTTVTALSEPRRLERVLRNLVINALTHAGGERVLVGVRRSRDKIRIEVCDLGRGIDPRHLAGMFQVGRHFGPTAGTGLGLASVWWLAGAMGHTLRVASAVGRGTCFSLQVRPAAL